MCSHAPLDIGLPWKSKNLSLFFQGEELFLRMDQLHMKNTVTSLKHGPGQHGDRFITKIFLIEIYQHVGLHGSPCGDWGKE
jgi:hypothetical protein